MSRRRLIAETDSRVAPLAGEPEPALDDPENPEWTEEDVARGRRVEDLPSPERETILANFPNTKVRGPQKVKPLKAQVTLRLDPDVLQHFRGTGRGWQSRINEKLREALPKGRATGRNG